VGKSTVSTQLAFGLAARGYQVGLLDLDICGPSIPRMCGVEHEAVASANKDAGWEPILALPNLCVMSVGLLLDDRDAAVVLRGPRKQVLIKQFLKDTNCKHTQTVRMANRPRVMSRSLF